jgi:hypothetical protein
MDDLETLLRKQMVGYLVSNTMLCPISGALLDVRTCVVLVDADGDPARVFSPEGWAKIAAYPDGLDLFKKAGLTQEGTPC